MGLEGGRTDSKALAGIKTYAKDLGKALLSLGINVNFAPVCDILTEPTNTAIGDRCFGTDLDSVEARARAFLEGLQEGGVLGCLKHFPGQGDAKADTHYHQAVIDADEETLMRREIAAFVDMLLLSPMVMISHCIYPALDDTQASLSAPIITGLLKKKLNYKGVVVSDDMIMAAVPQEEKIWQEKIVDSVAAGTDLILACKHLDRARLALEALRAKAKSSTAFRSRLEAAATQVRSLRKRL
jgi:beta-N-acetylhexosaminidase